MSYRADQWYDAYLYMEDETGQGAFDNVSLNELKALYARCKEEFSTRKRLALKGNIHRDWNDEYAAGAK